MDKSEFETYLGKYSKFVERYVYRKAPNKFEADDIIQEVYLSAYTSRETLADIGKFKAWIMSIAANKCADYYRRSYSSDNISLDCIREQPVSEVVTPTDAVWETLEKMPQRGRQLLIEYYINDMPQKEISRRMGCPVGTVKSRLYTAKNNFRSLYPKDLRKECINMKLPKFLPQIVITRLWEEPFEVVCTQDMGYFISPVLGEKCIFADYDFNSEGQLEKAFEEKAYAANKANIHGVECVEIKFDNGRRKMSHFMRLTETHLQMTAFLSIRSSDGEMYIHTFLDDEFFGKWGFGENNCGEEILRKHRGIIAENSPNEFITDEVMAHNLDICGRFRVSIGGREYDTVRSVYFNPFGELAENYIARDGKVVLFRRFDRTETIKESRDTVRVNGEVYEHITSGIADYSL